MRDFEETIARISGARRRVSIQIEPFETPSQRQ